LFGRHYSQGSSALLESKPFASYIKKLIEDLSTVITPDLSTVITL